MYFYFLTLRLFEEFVKLNNSLILYDAAYEALIQDKDIPHSIYEIDGARDCAIEFRSFSKNAGFTGVRCAFTVVPKNLVGLNSEGEKRVAYFLKEKILLNSKTDAKNKFNINFTNKITIRDAKK